MPTPRGLCKRIAALALVALPIAVPSPAWAGPPFLTDDPVPVGRNHWELYLASKWDFTRDLQTGTLPHIEVNYGTFPQGQVHLIVPAVFAHAPDDSTYGVGDIELGAKWRFLQEGSHHPQMGIYPLLTVPTGSQARNLGAGAVTAFLPLWIQKDFDPWLTYGGGGIRIAGASTDIEVGWQLQRQLTDPVSVGAEVYVSIPTNGSAVRTQINIGVMISFTKHHHVFVSAGPSFGQDSRGQAYLTYELTL